MKRERLKINWLSIQCNERKQKTETRKIKKREIYKQRIHRPTHTRIKDVQTRI